MGAFFAADVYHAVRGMLLAENSGMGAPNVESRLPHARVMRARPAAVDVHHADVRMLTAENRRLAALYRKARSINAGGMRTALADDAHYVGLSVFLAELRRLAAVDIEASARSAQVVLAMLHSRHRVRRPLL